MENAKRIWLICIFILLTIFLYYLSSYYSIYLFEKKEKNVIHTLENLQIQIETNQKNPTIWNYQYSSSSEKVYREEMDKNTGINEISDSNSKIESWKGDSILYIPDINLEKIVYTGKDRETHLQNYELVTACDNMKYENGGNYIICGHASKLYGHSLNRIKEVKEGTIIQIKTKNKTDKYIVKSVTYPNMNQTSDYCNQTTDNVITIISCAKYVSKESYIVIRAEYKE